MSFLDLFRSRPKETDELYKRIEQLESNFRLLEAEWNQMYDKILHSLERLAQRQRWAKQKGETTETETKTETQTDSVADLYARARRQGLI